jgi:hypothetical protein
MCKPVSTEGEVSRRRWWMYVVNGENEALREAFSPRPNEALWSKPMRRASLVIFAKIVAVFALVVGGLYALSTCNAQAQSKFPVTAKSDMPTMPNAEQLYHMRMMGMLVCPRMTRLMPRAALADELRQNYGELHERTVYITPDALAELYINRRSGSWSLVRTGPHKQACMISAGTRGFKPEEVPL